jgi:hypothetical protein
MKTLDEDTTYSFEDVQGSKVQGWITSANNAGMTPTYC